ncbi:hypothetical protein LSH36_251g06009 [Paralvinella palmiformis]|uniref:Coiled-coil domain-containing protein 25 n=1 Tax=Paralvinella palmiformis TaxID=53620 RepID=A0AAD9N5H2_9ANNE|nr:hypothetical protein LSH36_251g06009 [Paralvinella palmiformis]
MLLTISVKYDYLKVVSPPYHIYVGEDKHENEELIRWGWNEDVWFHVDKLSSAHVYLRLKKGETMNDIPAAVLEDCVQLVKANSIQVGRLQFFFHSIHSIPFVSSISYIPPESPYSLRRSTDGGILLGNKMNNIDVVYTMWSNLKKTPGMDVGQVGFHKQKEVQTVRVEKRINEIVNRLNKTKVEKHPDLRADREERDRQEREERKAELRELKKREKEEAEKMQKEAELRSYTNLMTQDKMTANIDAENDSDDFM